MNATKRIISWRLLTNVGYALVSQILGRGVVVASGMAVAKFMSVSEFATYSYVLITAALVVAFATGGISPTLGRYIAQAKVDDSVSLRQEILAACTILGALISVSIAAVYLLPRQWFNLPDAVSNSDLVLVATALLVSSALSAVANGAEMFSCVAKSAALQAIVLAAFCALAVGQGSLAILVFGLAASYVTSSLYLANKLLPLFRELGFGGLKLEPHSYFEVLRFCLPVFISSLLFSSAIWLSGRVLMQPAGDNEEFGVLAIGLQWFSLLLLVPNMVSRVLAPMITRQASSGHLGRERNPVVVSALLSVAAAACALVALILFMNQIARLYGMEKSSIGAVMLACGLAALLASPINAVGNAMIASRKQNRWLALACAWWLVLLLAIYFGRSYGAMGVAIALALSYCVHLPVVYISARAAKIV